MRNSYLWRLGEALDLFLNVVLFNGNPGETISLHAADAELHRERWACLMCAWLSRTVEPNHCQETLLGRAISQRGGLWAGLQLLAVFLLLTGAFWWMVHRSPFMLRVLVAWT